MNPVGDDSLGRLLDAALWVHWGRLLLQLALILVLLFWVVGARNRLSRLRQAIGQGWSQLDELLQRRAAALSLLMSVVRETLAPEAGSLQALEQALLREREAARAARLRPHAAEVATAWVAAERDLASPLARLQALLAHHPELDLPDDAREALQLLPDLSGTILYARQSVNQAVGVYNAALAEFPTRLLIPLFRLLPAAPV